LFIAIWLLLASTAGAQGLSDQIPAEHQAAVVAVSKTLEIAPDRAAAILRQMDFKPQSYGPAWAGFSEWPSLRKVEAAYMCAVRAGGVEEGQRFLQLYSRIIASDHTNAIRYESALKSFFPEPPAAPIVAAARGSIRFQALDTAVFTAPESIRDVVLAIERYVERVPGGLQSVMRGCCNLTTADVYEVLRTSKSRADALTRAIASGKIPPELKERLLRAIEMAAASSNALRAEPALVAELQELDRRADWASVHTVHDRPTPKVGDLPVAVQRNVDKLVTNAFISSGGTVQQLGFAQAETSKSWNQQRYARAIEDVRASREAQIAKGRYTFSGMTGSSSGFGGVVLGNSVFGPAELKPIDVSWVAEVEEPRPDEWGHFDLVLADGRTAYSRRFLSEDVYVATKLLRMGSGSSGSPLDLRRGEGIGIAGGEGHRYYLHPELDGLSIGDAAILVDARGDQTSAEALRSRLQQAHVSEKVLQKAEAWRRVASPGGYKIVDVPMTVQLSVNGLVRVIRAEHPSYSLALRASSLLTFTKFEGLTALPENATPFYEVMPALAATFPEFKRVNDLAEVFALVRWATLSGSNLHISTLEPKRGAQSHFVVQARDGDLALTRGHDMAQVFETLDTADRESRGILEKYDAPPTMLDRSQVISKLRRDMREYEAAWLQVADFADSVAGRGVVVRTRKLLEDAKKGKAEELDKLLDPDSLVRATLTAKDRAELDARTKKIFALEKELSAIEYQLPHSTLRGRLAHLPAASRISAERLLVELEGANMALYEADSGSDTERKAEARVTELEAQLGAILETPTERQLRSKYENRQSDLSRAEAELVAYRRTIAPWLDPWMRVQREASLW